MKTKSCQILHQNKFKGIAIFNYSLIFF
jgi:hypothetical protein